MQLFRSVLQNKQTLIKFFFYPFFFFITIHTNALTIIQKPILFNQDRINLTQEYRQQHYGISQSSIEIIPKMIVLHWTATDNLQQAFDFFYPPRIHSRPDIDKEAKLNTSAQFLVDRDGSIYQLMPSNWMARHVIGLNNIAIGIENVGGKNDVENLTTAQVTANVALIRELLRQYPDIHYLIGHYEYGQFRNSSLWQEKDPNYFTHKTDPGPKFMEAVRAQLQDLKLQGADKMN